MRTITTNYQEVSVKATKRWKDPDTGKTRQQTRRFYQTINPFNRDKDGKVKSREQILVEIRGQRDAWLKGEGETP